MSEWGCPRCRTIHRWEKRKPKRCRHCGFDPEAKKIIQDIAAKFKDSLRRLADK